MESEDFQTLGQQAAIDLAVVLGDKFGRFRKICFKCERRITDHPTTGRFHITTLSDPECALNQDMNLEVCGQEPEKSGHYSGNLELQRPEI